MINSVEYAPPNLMALCLSMCFPELNYFQKAQLISLFIFLSAPLNAKYSQPGWRLERCRT